MTMRFHDKFYPKAFQHSFHELRSEGLLCDVSLVVDGFEFQAHKLVLCAASPYFRVMFSTDTEYSFIESKQDKVNLYGIDKGALSDILTFIYSSDIKINDDNVFLLMEAANLLQIYALRTFISCYLQRSLTVENCIYLYVMADLHQYHDLANTAFKYLLENFSKVVEKEEFLDVPFEIFIKIVSSRLLDVKNEETLCELILRWVKADAESRKQHLDSLISEIDLHLLSTEYLKRIKNDPLITSHLKQKLDQITNFHCSQPPVLNVFGKYETFCLKKFRHKAEKAVIFAIGGESSGRASRSVECFTLGYDKWKYVVPEYIVKAQEIKDTNVLPKLRCARYYTASTHDCYNVYVIGGINSTNLCNECEVFNVRTNQWRYFQKLPVKLSASGAALLEGDLIVVGGFSEEGVSDKVWKLDKGGGSWISMPPLNSPRYFHAIASIGGYIFVMGGFDHREQPLRTCERFDPGCNKWFEVSSMHQARAKFGCAAVDNFIYVFGGICEENECIKSVEKFNIYTNEWLHETSMTVPRHSFSVAVSDDEIYCLGGCDYTHSLDTVEKFRLRTKRWHHVQSMQVSRYALASAALLVPYSRSNNEQP